MALLETSGAPKPSTPRLWLHGISLQFGGVAALKDVSLQIDAGALVALIGPNGAGKTSLVNCISGVYRPQAGSIRFEGRDITQLKPSARTRLGLARTFQNIALFKGMTVLDNLLIGRHFRQRTGVFAGGFWYGPGQREELLQRAVVEEIIAFLEIEHVRKAVVHTLPYGLQKRVELARALALEPKLLLLDEPMAGMNAREKEEMARFILEINQERAASVLMIEHDMNVVMDLSQRVFVLDFGELIAQGTPAEVQESRAVQLAYLGAEGAA
jgi:branched-chain amino acid transport system ATP-binding protein